MALTVGVATVMDAREVLLIVTGAHKSYALHKCIEEGISHMWTASALQQHPRACIVCDEDATLELKVKTVRYFKGIQETQETLMYKESESEPKKKIPENPIEEKDEEFVPNVTLPHDVPGGMRVSSAGAFFVPGSEGKPHSTIS